MSTPAQLAANIANAQHSTGPRTEAGKAASAKNATKSGLFSVLDFIRPCEESLYAELNESVRLTLAPVGDLEGTLVDEIRRAMWRLRRCGEAEAAMVRMCAGTCADAPDSKNPPIPDPMQIEATAKLQISIDRARSQCHRLLHKCTAELRKLQTERHYGNQTNDAGADINQLGLAETQAIGKAIEKQIAVQLRTKKLDISDVADIAMDNPELAENVKNAATIPVHPAVTKQTQSPAVTARNAACPCGSGQKHKRCCGKNAAPLLHAA